MWHNKAMSHQGLLCVKVNQESAAWTKAMRDARELIEQLTEYPNHITFIMSAISDKIEWTNANRKRILKNDEIYRISGEIPEFIDGSHWVEASDEIETTIRKFTNPMAYDNKRIQTKGRPRRKD